MKTVKILGYEVKEGTKKHQELLARKRHLDDLQKYENGSLLDAIKYNDNKAVDKWMEKAKSGEPMRIM